MNLLTRKLSLASLALAWVFSYAALAQSNPRPPRSPPPHRTSGLWFVARRRGSHRAHLHDPRSRGQLPRRHQEALTAAPACSIKVARRWMRRNRHQLLEDNPLFNAGRGACFRRRRHQPARRGHHGRRDDAGRRGRRCAAHAPSHLARPRRHGTVATRMLIGTGADHFAATCTWNRCPQLLLHRAPLAGAHPSARKGRLAHSSASRKSTRASGQAHRRY